MQLLQRLRKRSYWVVDFCKGSEIAKHLKDIESIIHHTDYATANHRKDVYLDSILKFATATVPFYQKLNGKNIPLETFPVINKNIIRDSQNDFRSSFYKDKTVSKVTTSGSTGTPFSVYQDTDKKKRGAADMIFYARQAGFELGNTLYYLRHWTRYYKKSKLLAWLQNVIQVEVIDFSDENIENLLIALASDQSEKGFLGYASSYQAICNYMERTEKKPKDYNITSIIAMSEGLSDSTKKGMEYYFKTPVVSRYSNMENGIIAQQLPKKGNDFQINWASYHIEVLELDSDIPVPFGTPGRIVVTDLFNKAMPLIRYDTGDVGVMQQYNPDEFPVLERIDGRKMDVILNTKGDIVSSFLILNAGKYKNIIQMQLVQESAKHYTFKLNTVDTFEEEETMRKEYQKYLGTDARIDFEYVDDIPLLASGKRKTIVNNYLKN
ncbi:CoF synthetase [Ascidiimonas aurantiaca]|uniref:CoF synthetase n=1 Tax=Ascidiimonas aurantiaca TaxID=1685432 RepID=UPI0030ED6EAE